MPIDSLLGGALASVGRFLKLVRKPGRKGAMVVKLGLMVYDLFGRRDRTMPDHRMVASAEFSRALPDLTPSTRYMAEFYDARLTAPERLGLELVADAEKACPASLAATYVSLVGRDGDTVVLEDTLTGERFEVSPKLVVNCSGAWVDRTDPPLGIEERLIGGTKGSHLVLDHPDFATRLDGRMLYFETEDHRICLAYPLDERRVLLGTTDIRTDDPEDTVCSAQEVDYLFEVMRAVMPDLVLDKGQIVFTYAGIRPLPASDQVAGAISRDHSVRVFEPDGGRRFPVLTLVGGKWTTFRPCAEQIVDMVLARLGHRAESLDGGHRHRRRRRISAQRRTSAAGWSPTSPAGAGCRACRVEVLLDRYGMRALDWIEPFAGRGPGHADDLARLFVCRISGYSKKRTRRDLVGRRSAANADRSARARHSCGDRRTRGRGGRRPWLVGRPHRRRDQSNFTTARHATWGSGPHLMANARQKTTEPPDARSKLGAGLSGLQTGTGTPLWSQVKTALMTLITTEKLSEHARLPSEAELCEHFGVSRTVVREALNQLVFERVIYKLQGKGPSSRPAATNRTSWARTSASPASSTTRTAP